MKFSRTFALFYIISVFWIVKCQRQTAGSNNNGDTKSSRTFRDHLTNADLHHLLSLIDDSEPVVGGSSLVTSQANLDSSSNLESSTVTDASSSKAPEIITTTSVPNVVTPVKLIRRRKIRVLETTTTTSTLAPPIITETTTKFIPTKTTTTSSGKELISVSSTVPTISRREDTQIENLREIVPPSQQELVQQLSLLNSLLTSLGDNATKTSASIQNTKNSESKIETTKLTSETNKNSKNNLTSPEAQLALLTSLFGSASGSEVSNNDALLALGASGSSNVATRQTTTTTGKGNSDSVLSEAALSDFLRQAAAVENQRPQGNNNGNQQQGQLDAASSNQISTLLSLLGTLGNAAGQPQQQSNSQLNFPTQSHSSQQDQSNFLASVLGNQQQQPLLGGGNDLSSLLNQPQNQPFSLGNLLASQISSSSIPGLGLLSGVGSLGSSIISTMSNILGGSGFGGKPRVRGKGIDTRVGLGYRFGDAADAQLMWDIGPQLFTDTLKNELRSPMIKSRSSDGSLSKSEQQASNRQLKLQVDDLSKKHAKQVFKKASLSSLDKSNSGKQRFSTASDSKLNIPQQVITPPELFNLADQFQMARNKNFMKRSSPNQKPYYTKAQAIDDSFADHSTLTAYEKMLLAHGKEYGIVEGEGKKEQHIYNSFKKPQTTETTVENYDVEFNEFRKRPTKSRNPPRRNPFSFKPFRRNNKNRRRRPKPIKNKVRNSGENSKQRQTNREDSNYNKDDFAMSNQKVPGTSSPYVPYDDAYENNNNKHSSRPNSHNEDLYKDHKHSHSSNRPNYNRDVYEGDKTSHYQNGPNTFSGDVYEEGSGNVPQRPKPTASQDEHQYTEEEYRPRPHRRPKNPKSVYAKDDPRRRNQGFSFTRFFSKLWRGNSANRRNRNHHAEQRNDYASYDSFPTVDNDFTIQSSDRFYARNSNIDPTEFTPRSNFNLNFFRHRNRFQPQPKPAMIHKTVHMHSAHTHNPEADDSFLRRNAVVTNPKLRDSEKQKLLHPTLPSSNPSPSASSSLKMKDEDTNVDVEDASLQQSMMSIFKKFISPKTRSNSSVGSISSLTRLLSNPSSFNPMTILPSRRNKKPTTTRPETVKTRLTIVNGKPQIVNVTKVEEPIVHVGEDMSFEDLTKLFGKNTTTKSKGKKKSKPKKQSSSKVKVDSRKDEDLEESIEERADKTVDKVKANTEDSEEYDDDDDGLKGIFIDIDSGEVNVLKPVASLTSFEPKKESSEEEMDEYEDGDGDGIADADIIRKQNIFDDIQKELKRNYDKMKKAHQRAEAKQKRKEELVAKGMDESVDVVSKYFDMIDETHANNKKTKLKVL